MKKLLGLFSLLLLILNTINAQNIHQSIRGRIVDKESQSPLIGVTIMVLDTSIGTITDGEGYFKLSNIPLGRHKIKISYIGYKELLLSDIVVNSAKEVILNIELEESPEALEEVVVTGTDKSGTVNEMALVGTRSFSVSETERYAGSRGDPARMASNFAGVQGSDDSRNDIVIRGNSPMGVLYRLNDIDIPNPNHFAVAGTTGGPVSILNNKVLATSDFMTGAFPAEYGNALAGVFDVRMRNGNNEKYEYTGQLGFLGTELTAEGPFSKSSKSSFLVNYRYSTLALFSTLNFKIGTSAVPRYQDASFKLNFPTKKAGTFSVFGIGGKSNIDIVLSPLTDPSQEIYGQKDRDQYFGSSMGVVGATHAYTINSTTFSKLTIAASVQNSNAYHVRFWRDTNYVLTAMRDQLNYTFRQSKITLAYSVNKKLNIRNTVKVGVFIDRYFFYYKDSIYREELGRFQNRLDAVESSFFIQPYIQWKYLINDQISLSAGIHYQHFFLNHSATLEPRVGAKWRINNSQSLSFGYGLHSQMLPGYIYFYHRDSPGSGLVQNNRGLEFMKSHHFVLGYDKLFSSTLRAKVETYYQYLFNVPITYYPSSFSLLNQGSSFTRFFPDPLQNAGTGRNHGIELTLEKFFSNHYFFMFTTSIYDSKYKGSDGITRNTDFNGNFATNLLAGTEFNLGAKKKTVFFNSIKITWAGGRRYGPVDKDSSNKIQEVVYLDLGRNSRQFRDYFRTDFRIGFRWNNPKVTHEIALDLVNVFSNKNLLGITYAPDPVRPEKEPFVEEYQLGFLPLFYYKVDF